MTEFRTWALAEAGDSTTDSIEAEIIEQLDALLARIWPALRDTENRPADDDTDRESLYRQLDYARTTKRYQPEDPEQPDHRLLKLFLLNRWIAYGNAQGYWHIELFPVPLPVTPDTETLRPSQLVKASGLSENLDNILSAMVGIMPNSDDPDMLFALIVSLDAGITNTPAFKSLAYPHARHLLHIERLPHVKYDLSAFRKKQLTENWRYQLLPLKSYLAAHHLVQSQASRTVPSNSRFSQRVINVLKVLRRELPESRRHIPGTLKEWQKTVEYCHRLRGWPWVSAALAGCHHYHAFDQHTLKRIYSGQPLGNPTHRQAGTRSAPRQAYKHLPGGNLLAELDDIVAGPKQAKKQGQKPPKPSDTVERLNQLLSSTPHQSPLRALTLWMRQKYEKLVRKKNQASSTLYDDFKHIRQVIIHTQTPLDEPITQRNILRINRALNPDHEATQIQASAKRRYKLGKLFQQFHTAIWRECGWPAPYPFIRNHDYEANEGSPLIVTPQDFDRAIERFDPDIWDDRQIRIIMRLMFRCGLRIDEACKLLIGDISGEKCPYLWVRDNRFRNLKTQNGPCRLPLYALFNSVELAELRDYLSELPDSHNNPLFPRSGHRNRPLNQGAVGKRISQALRQASHDDNLVPHHLRHSAVIWLMLALMMPKLPENSLQGIAALNHPDFSAARQQRLSQALLGASPGGEILALAAKFLGHGSMEVTLESYLHFMPLLQALLRLDSTAIDYHQLEQQFDLRARQIRNIVQGHSQFDKGITGLYQRQYWKNPELLTAISY